MNLKAEVSFSFSLSWINWRFLTEIHIHFDVVIVVMRIGIVIVIVVIVIIVLFFLFFFQCFIGFSNWRNFLIFFSDRFHKSLMFHFKSVQFCFFVLWLVDFEPQWIDQSW